MATTHLLFACLLASAVLCCQGVQTISKVQLPHGVLRPRHPAPAFKAQAVIDETFVEVKLNDYEGEWLVLMFYPFDFTFVCPTEVTAMPMISAAHDVTQPLSNGHLHVCTARGVQRSIAGLREDQYKGTLGRGASHLSFIYDQQQ